MYISWNQSGLDKQNPETRGKIYKKLYKFDKLNNSEISLSLTFRKSNKTFTSGLSIHSGWFCGCHFGRWRRNGIACFVSHLAKPRMRLIKSTLCPCQKLWQSNLYTEHITKWAYRFSQQSLCACGFGCVRVGRLFVCNFVAWTFISGLCQHLLQQLFENVPTTFQSLGKSLFI